MTTLILLALNRIHAIFFCKLQKKIGIGGGDAERADLVTSSQSAPAEMHIESGQLKMHSR